ncbi:uncharacterized protein PGTG_12129 [Puccinia graminis f. sp. tritici CRL 75-36-700-3]|uniref:Uncharacterized protein n=1 Tax=Puccinia graminis f. sp. tritici (strain CRL 75-36-700-3 / race SCCL) TaxID=418459 RepID=E3KPE8_PUCGT|nr:uncharacterized protein PGTG_12129 [Puccinia graminis f. sp. tritici CRL 75-36-700-3]EFP86173.1 hypothetical protein PGTG_12129 [Puccinia graminis f. sp. tritici CRL 75-36-700-3]
MAGNMHMQVIMVRASFRRYSRYLKSRVGTGVGGTGVGGTGIHRAMVISKLDKASPLRVPAGRSLPVVGRACTASHAGSVGEARRGSLCPKQTPPCATPGFLECFLRNNLYKVVLTGFLSR